jgi:hypothetical protein
MASTVGMTVHEYELKAIVLTYLRSEGRLTRRSIIANEFALRGPAVRADMAILDRHFTGIEVKSERDTFRRLDRQLATYRKYFDYTILAVASKHVATLDSVDLHGAAVWEITKSGNVCVLREERVPLSLERNRLSGLLTQAERRRYAEKGAPSGQTLDDRRDLCAATSDIDRAAFAAAFRQRFADTTASFWKQVGRRKICGTDLGQLSRNYETRAAARLWNNRIAQRWADWLAEINAACAAPQSVHSSSVS